MLQVLQSKWCRERTPFKSHDSHVLDIHMSLGVADREMAAKRPQPRCTPDCSLSHKQAMFCPGWNQLTPEGVMLDPLLSLTAHVIDGPLIGS